MSSPITGSAGTVEAPLGRLAEELAWLRFYLPRQAVQLLSRRLPLSRLRAALPAVVGERLRLGLYPARVTSPHRVLCARVHPPWGQPPDLSLDRGLAYEAPPRASVLLVTYNNLDLTRLCLCSLQRGAGTLPFEIIAVDNASSDGTAQYLRETEARGLLPLRVVVNRDNRGLSAANNQAAALAHGDVLVFLNNDTVVTPGWLERLVGHLDRDPGIGLIGPATNSCGNEAQVGTPYEDLGGMFEFAAGYTKAHGGELIDLGMLVLFCAAMPRALFAAVGGLDEGYGVGLFEDDELSMAVRALGRRTVLCREVFVHHYGGAAFAGLDGRDYLRLWWRNRRRFEGRWGPWQAR